MNELYEQTIQHCGRTYRYDPDRDCFYREHESTGWDTWGWLAVILALVAIGLCLEFWPIR
jgi:hypothetical protein